MVCSKPSFCTVWQRQQMVVACNRETFKPALIEVPVPERPVRNSPAHGVHVREPPDKVRQLTVLLRPHDKVPVVGQNTIRENADWLPLVRPNFTRSNASKSASLRNICILPTDRFRTW